MCRAWVALFIVGCNDAPSIVDAGSDADSNVLASEVPFSATGPWRTKLPATTPIATNSDAIVANIQADIKNNYGTFAINTDTYSSPIWTAPQNAKVSDFTFNGCQGSLDSQFAACLKGVPTVAEMFPSLGTDSEITIYSPSLDEEWEFWVAKSDDAGAWSACWGGCITGVKANPGIFPAPIGATASGLPLLGFLVRIDELAAGEITHAINICVVRTQATNFSWPANRTDGNTADSDVLMEGQRLRLDPTFDVSTLPIPAERTIAKAMQDYGMILTDTSGAVDLQAEDPRSWNAQHNGTGDPYATVFGGRANYAVLQEIPVSKLQALPKDYGMDFMH